MGSRAKVHRRKMRPVRRSRKRESYCGLKWSWNAVQEKVRGMGTGAQEEMAVLAGRSHVAKLPIRKFSIPDSHR